MARKRRYLPDGFCQDDFKAQRARQKPAKALLIVTEGRNTEPHYFNALKEHWNVHPKVLAIEPGGEGIPANLVARADREIKSLKKKAKRDQLANNELDRFDEVWIVFDCEHAQRQGRLRDGIEAAEQKKYKIAPSNPCFEFWLALHHSNNAPPMTTCDEACRHLESVGNLTPRSYSKTTGASAELIGGLIQEVPAAVRNADIVTRNQQSEAFPANPSTQVQKLVRSIHASLPGDMKKRFELPELPPQLID